jgi:translation initiation factor 1
MSKSGRIATDGGAAPLHQNPFGALSATGLPRQPEAPVASEAKKNRGRVEVRRETQGRGGKTVTTVSGFTGIGLPEKEDLAKRIQKACGAGGTVKDGQLVIQGDQREVAVRILEEAGFRAVLAGG